MQALSAQSPTAQVANALILDLQARFVGRLEALSAQLGHVQPFEAVAWGRDGGRHGGGQRWGCGDTLVFNRASVNQSQVHYDDEPDKALGSASALSCIVHPHHPFAPSLHLHISWTEMKSGTGYWRIMADLNPALSADAETLKVHFEACLQQAAPGHWQAASAQGDRYFYIPALGRHRGLSHFYLEAFHSDDAGADLALAQRCGEAVIDSYPRLVARQVQAHPQPTRADWEQQRAYHTLYFFQVLTLDRGTTSGLLVHDQNDVGILGSLPAEVDRELLASWRSALPAPQEQLLDALLAALPAGPICRIEAPVKQRLAAAVRAHYLAHPEALALQASGDQIPPTVANHAAGARPQT
ncbi:MAG: coproporphyrinogen III oxidase [Candidatus Sericytochromatia bacterium]